MNTQVKNVNSSLVEKSLDLSKQLMFSHILWWLKLDFKRKKNVYYLARLAAILSRLAVYYLARLSPVVMTSSFNHDRILKTTAISNMINKKWRSWHLYFRRSIDINTIYCKRNKSSCVTPRFITQKVSLPFNSTTERWHYWVCIWNKNISGGSRPVLD